MKRFRATRAFMSRVVDESDSLNKSNSNVSVDQNETFSSHSPTTSTSASIDALQIITAANNHDNLFTSDNQNVIDINVDNIQFNLLSSPKQPSRIATITANEKNPSREQAIIFNFIEGLNFLFKNSIMAGSSSDSQTNKIFFSVYNFIKDLSLQDEIVPSMFAQCLKVTAEACGLSERAVRRVCKEGKDSLDPEQQVASFKSRKTYKSAKPLTELDDFDADIVRRILHEFYNRGEIAKKSNTFKMADVENVLHLAMEAATQEDWEKCVAHVEKIQDEDNSNSILRDVMLKPIIITLQDDDSDWGDEEDDEDIFILM
ncbi:hypothetical protein QTP88_008871 [Uroleucon formosanum]